MVTSKRRTREPFRATEYLPLAMGGQERAALPKLEGLSAWACLVCLKSNSNSSYSWISSNQLVILRIYLLRYPDSINLEKKKRFQLTTTVYLALLSIIHLQEWKMVTCAWPKWPANQCLETVCQALFTQMAFKKILKNHQLSSSS